MQFFNNPAILSMEIDLSVAKNPPRCDKDCYKPASAIWFPVHSYFFHLIRHAPGRDQIKPVAALLSGSCFVSRLPLPVALPGLLHSRNAGIDRDIAPHLLWKV